METFFSFLYENTQNKNKKFKQQLQKGIKVELEHTTSRIIAKEIATDHIFEDPKYYDKLKDIEESMVAGGTGSVFSDGSADIGAQGGKVPGNFDGPVKGDARPHTFYGKKQKVQRRKKPETINTKKKKKKCTLKNQKRKN